MGGHGSGRSSRTGVIADKQKVACLLCFLKGQRTHSGTTRRKGARSIRALFAWLEFTFVALGVIRGPALKLRFVVDSIASALTKCQWFSSPCAPFKPVHWDQGARFGVDLEKRRSLMSRIGGCPKNRLYSRLN